MKAIKLGLVCMSLGLVLVGCGSNSTKEKEVTPVPAKSAENTKQEKSSDAEIEELDEVIETTETLEETGLENALSYSTSWTDEWNGLKFTIDEVMLAQFDTPEQAEEFGVDGQGALGIHYIIENTSDNDFDTYPDQGTAVVLGQQIEAEMFISDDLGGEILSGVKKEGIVTYSIPSVESIEDINDIRLKWSASNMDTEDFDNMFYDFDITVTLK